jgi:hypothetical protein
MPAPRRGHVLSLELAQRFAPVAGTTWTCRSCTTTARGDPPLSEARLRARAGLLRQEPQPDQRKAVRGTRRDEGPEHLRRIIVDEARRRGIHAEVIDAPAATSGSAWAGAAVACRESLSALTSAIAMSLCDDKRVTRRVLARRACTRPSRSNRRRCCRRGCSPSWPATRASSSSPHAANRAAASRSTCGPGRRAPTPSTAARQHCDMSSSRRWSTAIDLRIVVIDHAVVAAATRRPRRCGRRRSAACAR